MNPLISKRSVVIDGHRTSVSLEDAFWDEVKRLAKIQGVTVSAFVGAVDAARMNRGNLSSSLRLKVLHALRPTA